MVDGIKNALKNYDGRGLEVTKIMADNKFECVRAYFTPIELETIGAGEHVPNIERANRSIKDATRTQIHRLPYQQYPKAMVDGCVLFVTHIHNNTPSDAGLSPNLSPQLLVRGSPPPVFNTLAFGDYVQVHVRRQITNTMESCSCGAIALYPPNPSQKSWYFMSLETGKIIHRHRWTILPLPQDVIDRVHEIATSENQPPISDNFIFRWSVNDLPEPAFDQGASADEIGKDSNHRAPHPIIPSPDTGIAPNTKPNDIPIDDTTLLENTRRGSNDDRPQAEGTHDDNLVEGAHDDDPLQDEGAQWEDEGADLDEDLDEAQVEENVANAEEPPETKSVHDKETTDDLSVDDISMAGSSDAGDSDNSADGEDSDLSMDISDDEPMTDTNKTTELQTGRRVIHHNYKSLNSKGVQFFQSKRRTSSKKGNNKKKLKRAFTNMFKNVVGIVMNQMSEEEAKAVATGADFEQMSMRARIKKVGKKAIAAVLSKYMQLNNLETMTPVDPNSLTAKQKEMALELLTFIKQKRCGKMKSRACANGKKQQRYIKQEDVASPTIQLESLILAMLIDAFEGRDVATADVVGAYLKTGMTETVHVKLVGESADIMCKVNEDCKQFITKEKGKNTLYMRLNKALYGCMQSALLWYNTYSRCLKQLGFRLNPYNPCVANKVINGERCTVCWYVDDSKISHRDPRVVTEVIQQIEKSFGKMTVKRGKEHVFVGIAFKIREDGKIEIRMKDYLLECLASYGEDVKSYKTPAKKELFEINWDSNELNEEKSELFHHIVAKLLFVAKQARLDIDLAISFLCTRVSCSTDEDWEKLGRVLGYIKRTIEMPRIIGTNNMQTMHTWVDASYATHDNMRGHTGGVISMGVGAVHHKTSKQKLNTKSSTESELVGASDYIPWTVWTKRFLEGQGYSVKRNLFYQDNESAMKLETNGRSSCGEKSRHIHIRYFFIKDVLKRESIEMKHCPTEIMIANFFTKPLQGKLFHKMRDIIMGHAPLPVEERVEGNTNEAKSQLGNKDFPGGSTGRDGRTEIKKTYLEALLDNQEKRMVDRIVKR